MKCNICGYENPPGGGFCGGCGAWIAHQPEVPQQNEPVQSAAKVSLEKKTANQPVVQAVPQEQPAPQPNVQRSMDQQPVVMRQPVPQPVYHGGQNPPGGVTPPPAGNDSGAGIPPEKPKKKKPVWLFILIPVVLAAVLAVGYFTIHVWTDPTCTRPAECRICGIIGGNPTGHSWKAADCQNPKTCMACGDTKGGPAEHEWLDPDCLNPSTCSFCGETKGEPIPHEWMAADCTHPQTCSGCGQTQGSSLGHSWRDADCTTPETCEACGLTDGTALGHEWEAADYEQPKTCGVCGEEEGNPVGYLGTVNSTWSDDKVSLYYGNVHYKIFDQQITNCRRFTLNLELTAQSGSYTGTWGVYIKAPNGQWKYIDDFRVTGGTTVVTFAYDEDEAITFEQMALTLNENKSCTYTIAFKLTDVQVYVD